MSIQYDYRRCAWCQKDTPSVFNCEEKEICCYCRKSFETEPVGFKKNKGNKFRTARFSIIGNVPQRVDVPKGLKSFFNKK